MSPSHVINAKLFLGDIIYGRTLFCSDLPTNFSVFLQFPAHVDNEMCLVRALERLGTVALSKEEPDIGAAFLKFSVVTKELSALMKTLVS